MMKSLIERNMAGIYDRQGQKSNKVSPCDDSNCKSIIITCSCPCIDPVKIFGLLEGESVIIRTTGNIITGEAIRCIMLALLTNNKIGNIIVLGHSDCVNANLSLFYSKYPGFLEKLPFNSWFRETLGTKEKALKYFGSFKDVIYNARVQVENLRFLKTIKSELEISGAIYNEYNEHVYSLDEIDEQARGQNMKPSLSTINIPPSRYEAFKRARMVKKDLKLTASRKGIQDDQKMIFPSFKQENENTQDGQQPQQVNELLNLEMGGQKLAFEKMMEAMEKSISKATKVRVFVPKIRMPRVKAIKKKELSEEEMKET